MKKFPIFIILTFAGTPHAMELPPLKDNNQGVSTNAAHAFLNSGSCETPYSLMQYVTKGIDEDKKIKEFHKTLIRQDLTTYNFLEKFFEEKKIDVIMQEKKCSISEAKKILYSIPSSKLTFSDAEVACNEVFPKSTQTMIIDLVKDDPWFKDVPVVISFAPEFDVVAHITPQNPTTKTFDIAIGPLFYYCLPTDTQKTGCIKHELAHAKQNHPQITKYAAEFLPKSDLRSLKRLFEYEADLFAAAQDSSSAYQVESLLKSLKQFSDSDTPVTKELIASHLPQKIRDSFSTEELSSDAFNLKTKQDHPSITERYLNAKMVRKLLALEKQKNSCHLM
jgi:hypothetical protein